MNNKPTTGYHFERKKQLQEYKGDQSRLKFILEKDHGEAIKDSMTSPIIDKHKTQINKEEFIRNMVRENPK